MSQEAVMSKSFRIGLIVPSSNTTMETEIPAMLARRAEILPERFTFHSSRMRMKKVSPEELAKMDAESDRCALELSDARCDVLAYACLVAIMATAPRYHLKSEARLVKVTEQNGAAAPVVTSAGALVNGIQALGARKVSIVAPYMKPLTKLVVDYLGDCGIEVIDAISLEVPDNIKVGRLDPTDLIGHAGRLNVSGADAVVLSACVQMPSLPAIQEVEDRLGLPVLSAAVATTYELLSRLDVEPKVPRAGALLSGKPRVAKS
jgi:maleate isomerase